MVQSLLAILAIAVLIGMSFRANARFREESRLPMQWGFDGSVNWTAPRRLALSLTPVLGSIILAAATASTLLLAPRPGQAGKAIPVILILGLGFIAVHGLHLWLIRRTLKRGGD
ncbi:MAG: hypothetical protein H6978_00020 [Gammaproteobacteria bacterium]|nr:hypothetical protein [Novosphingobium sp.]MCP5143188.1 hypothetical protein [Gammaproteobacteria bacterium]